MNTQDQHETWNELKDIWGNSAKGSTINFQVSELVNELKSKMSEFEKTSIQSDMSQLKISWEDYKGKVSQFEKDSISKDLSMISGFFKRFLRLFKKK